MKKGILKSIIDLIFNSPNNATSLQLEETSPSPPSEEKDKEHLPYLRLYEHTNEKLQTLLERKRHIEIKSLYTLQASTIVVTLFTALLGSIRTLDGAWHIVGIILTILFYIIITLCIGFLLISLDDTIVKWWGSKKTNNVNTDKDAQNTENTSDINNGLYLDTPNPIVILEAIENGTDINTFYKKLIKTINNKSIESADKIAIAKANCFHYGIRLFIAGIIVVIALGIIIA